MPTTTSLPESPEAINQSADPPLTPWQAFLASLDDAPAITMADYLDRVAAHNDTQRKAAS